MISRVAECCFWLGRYWERAEATTRLVAVNRLSLLDAEIEGAERWLPAIVVIGERERFEKLHDEVGYSRDAIASRFLTWSPDNPNSVLSCFRSARENARTTREVISREMWEAVNVAWQWLSSGEGEKAYRRDSAAFFERLQATFASFHGVAASTMLHGEAYDFLRFGADLERAEQTARLLDAHYYRLPLGDFSQVETPIHAAQWMLQLRLSAAVEPFFKVNRIEPTAKSVCRFLLQEARFPRSVSFGLERAKRRLDSILKGLDKQPKHAAEATRGLERSLQRLRDLDVERLIEHNSLHDELTALVTVSAETSRAVDRAFFSAPRTTQSQSAVQ